MIDDKEIWCWTIEYKECPHCNKKISLDYTSHKSLKDLLKNFYERINFHLKNQCINYRIKKINKISIKSKMINNTNRYENINILF